MFIDSHAHLTGDTLYPDLELVLERAKLASVGKVINICTDLKTLERGLTLSLKHPWILNAGATTPHDLLTEGEALFSYFEKAAQSGKLISIGETGLDYHYEHSPKELQKVFFKRYLKLALSLDLPLIIHCREAFEDLIAILDSDYPSSRGVLHCFTGTLKDAEALVQRGWMISFSGIITFKKSEALREVVASVPIEHILIETDAPYLAPHTKRGKTNEPAFILETAKKVAEIKGITLQEVAKQTYLNACRLFRIPSE